MNTMNSIEALNTTNTTNTTKVRDKTYITPDKKYFFRPANYKLFSIISFIIMIICLIVILFYYLLKDDKNNTGLEYTPIILGIISFISAIICRTYKIKNTNLRLESIPVGNKMITYYFNKENNKLIDIDTGDISKQNIARRSINNLTYIVDKALKSKSNEKYKTSSKVLPDS